MNRRELLKGIAAVPLCPLFIHLGGSKSSTIRIVMFVDESVIPANIVSKMFKGKLPVEPIIIPVSVLPPGRSIDDVVKVKGGPAYTEYCLDYEQTVLLCTSLRGHWQPAGAPLPKEQWTRRSENRVLTIAITGWTGHESSFWHLTHCHPKIAAP
jgi:hypothetical protein